MSSFSAEWLALREPYDRAARSTEVLEAVAEAFRDAPSIAVVDLACGSGATLRALASRLPPRQRWRLVDNNLSLLAKAAAAGHPAEWLDRLVIEAAARRLPVYAALTCDGRVAVEPARSLDTELLAGFDLHQRTDKGFGPALGPAAAAHAVERFEHFGYRAVQGRADWVFGPDDRAVQDALFAGWAEVAPLTTGLSPAAIDDWLARRRADLAQGRSRLRVGHLDIFARPMGTR
jgi:hypothetical protein